MKGCGYSDGPHEFDPMSFSACRNGPWARSHLHSVGPRPSYASSLPSLLCPHLRGNSSLLGTTITIPGHLSH